MAKTTSALPRQWMLIGIVLIIAAIATYLVWFSPFLSARLSGRDVAMFYSPLVRHLVSSQVHCYDTGTQYCEQFMQAEKEFTVAYLFRDRPRNLPVNQIYGCFDRQKRSTYLITTDYNECRQQRLYPYFFGYTAQNQDFEAPVMLHRCFEQGSGNYLVTDDRRECELTGHTDEIKELGYAAMAGHLSARRLEGLCNAAEQGGVLADARGIFCGSQVTATTTPTPEPEPDAVSWQNPKNKYDVSNDGRLTPVDIIYVINAYNRGGSRVLTVDKDGTPPPYVDVDGDGSITHKDVLLIRNQFGR